MANVETRTVSKIINNEYKDYAMYVIENRAIPCYVDGLKPSSKKLLYSMINYYKGKKVKNSELSASIASVANYHHGNASSDNTVVTMGAKWNNHVPLFEAYGNFGSRLVTTPASSRYIFSSLSTDYHKYFKDDVVCNKNIDPDNPEPQQYLPIIPFVLVNGIEGIAVGFACKFLPHLPSDIAKACMLAVDGKLDDNYHLPVTFPHYNGKVVQLDSKRVKTQGIVTPHKRKNTWLITEVQWEETREKVFNKLVKMMDNRLIDDFDDLCDDDGFKFLVKLTNEQNSECVNDPISYFKLETSFKENYTALDEKGELIIFDNKVDIIKRFVQFRISKVAERLEYDKDILLKQIHWCETKKKFIVDVISNEISIMSIKKVDLVNLCIDRYNIESDIANKLVSTPIYDMTKDQIEILDKKIKQLNVELNKNKKTNPTKEYISMLKDIIQ